MNNMTNQVIPYVIEQTRYGERSFDIYSRLMKDRIIFLGTPIDDAVSSVIIAQLLHLASEDPEKDINIYVNSPGGSVSAGLAIYDTMQHVRPNIATICVGLAASMAQVILCAGTEGKRFALPHSRIMMHQPMGGTQGQASDIEIYTNEMIRIREELYAITARHSGKTVDEVRQDSDRDNYMSAQEAKDYGMIDAVLDSSKSGK